MFLLKKYRLLENLPLGTDNVRGPISEISIITQVIIEILAPSLAENGVLSGTIITSGKVIIAGGQIFKMASSRFVVETKQEINLIKDMLLRGISKSPQSSE